MHAPMNGFFRKYMGGDDVALSPVQLAMMGFDPNLGVDVVGGPGAWAGRQAFQRWQQNRCARGRLGEGVFEIGGDEEELSGEEAAELSDFDDELGSLDDDAAELGGNDLGREEDKLKKMLSKAQKNVAKAKRKLIDLAPWRKKARRRWEQKLEEAKGKEKEIKEALRSLRGAANPQGQGQGVPGQPGGYTGGQMALPNYRQGLGVTAVAQAPGAELDLPIVFDATGTEHALIAITSGDLAGEIQGLSGYTKQYTYLELKVLGFKVNVQIKPLTYPGTTPLFPLFDNSAQVHVLLTSLMVDGGFDLVPDAQVLDLSGPFGTNNQQEFQGLRFQDTINPNGKAKFSGGLQLGFTALADYQVSVRAAVRAAITRDYRREGAMYR
ncbi:hypothetical protein L6R46_20310 [Myxococcota bacterium]|nr:hypothetical protein [Myxococcota bacterium]